jgi:hypothetical protein
MILKVKSGQHQTASHHSNVTYIFLAMLLWNVLKTSIQLDMALPQPYHVKVCISL